MTYDIAISNISEGIYAEVVSVINEMGYTYVESKNTIYVSNVIEEDFTYLLNIFPSTIIQVIKENVGSGNIYDSVFNPYNFLWPDWRLLTILAYQAFDGGAGTVGGITGTEYFTIYGPLTGSQLQRFVDLAQELGVAIVQSGEDEKWRLTVGPMTSTDKVKFQLLADSMNVDYDNNPGGNIPPIIPPGEGIMLSRQEFIELVAPYMQQRGKELGWLPSIAISQAILESGNGNSGLTAASNNLYGYKWYGYGPYVECKTQEWDPVNKIYYDTVARFKAYPNWNACIDDYFELVTTNKRYTDGINNPDYRSVAWILQNNGYSTAPTYADTVINIIEANNLTRFD